MYDCYHYVVNKDEYIGTNACPLIGKGVKRATLGSRGQRSRSLEADRSQIWTPGGAIILDHFGWIRFFLVLNYLIHVLLLDLPMSCGTHKADGNFF